MVLEPVGDFLVRKPSLVRPIGLAVYFAGAGIAIGLIQLGVPWRLAMAVAIAPSLLLTGIWLQGHLRAGRQREAEGKGPPRWGRASGISLYAGIGAGLLAAWASGIGWLSVLGAAVGVASAMGIARAQQARRQAPGPHMPHQVSPILLGIVTALGVVAIYVVAMSANLAGEPDADTAEGPRCSTPERQEPVHDAARISVPGGIPSTLGSWGSGPEWAVPPEGNATVTFRLLDADRVEARLEGQQVPWRVEDGMVVQVPWDAGSTVVHVRAAGPDAPGGAIDVEFRVTFPPPVQECARP